MFRQDDLSSIIYYNVGEVGFFRLLDLLFCFIPVAHFHDFALEIFHSGVGAAVLAALQRVGWSVHVGQKRDFVNPQGVDDDMHMDIPAVVMPVRVGAD